MELLLGEGLKTLNCKKSDQSDLCKKKAIRAVNNSTFKAHSNPLFSKLKVLNLDDTYKLCVLTFMHGDTLMITFPLPSKICLSLQLNRIEQNHVN